MTRGLKSEQIWLEDVGEVERLSRNNQNFDEAGLIVNKRQARLGRRGRAVAAKQRRRRAAS